MSDWSAALDNFLHDTELPVLEGAGTVSHEEALDWADAQYDSFSNRRRLEAESEGAERYVDDLTATARLLERRGPAAKRKAQTPRGNKQKRGRRTRTRN